MKVGFVILVFMMKHNQNLFGIDFQIIRSIKGFFAFQYGYSVNSCELTKVILSRSKL